MKWLYTPFVNAHTENTVKFVSPDYFKNQTYLGRVQRQIIKSSDIASLIVRGTTKAANTYVLSP